MVTSTATRTRMTAEERRRQVVEIAREEFAVHGLHGTSTERIAERVGVSQPYLFRLFGTKKQLFLASVEAGFRHVLELFRKAADGVERTDVMEAMGEAYAQLLRDRTVLLAQMQAYAACDDEEIRAAVRQGYADLYRFVASASGAGEEELQSFFAFGMLMNVVAAMDLSSLEEQWAKDIVNGCLP
jgi:AcrR family transcriptional regulator